MAAPARDAPAPEAPSREAPSREAPADAAPAAPEGLAIIAESWLTEPYPAEHNIDSLAVWAPDRRRARLLVTAKELHRVLVHDAATGGPVGAFGEPGDGPGQLRRPNGIAVLDDMAVVVERDNARLQVFGLRSGFESLGTFGADVLRRPYGIAGFASGPGTWELYVTDNYETPRGTVPPAAELGERVRHFRLRAAGGELRVELVRSFGDTAGPGVLHKVESVVVDPAHGRLLVAQEEPPGLEVLAYDLEGRFRGESLGAGVFEFEPEGMALWECGDAGFWLVTDQEDSRSRFHVFERRSLSRVGGFIGERTANTDGVALTRAPLPGLPAGAFYAVHDDVAVAAFDWRRIAEALGLPTACEVPDGLGGRGPGGAGLSSAASRG